MKRRDVLQAGAAALGGLAGMRAAGAAKKPHVVFVIGEDEYKSETTLPPIAEQLAARHGMRTTVLTAQPDPKNARNIPGLEALESADLAVFYLRWRELPDDQLKRILAYTDSGRSVMGFRTSTHSFRYPAGSPNERWNDDFGRDVLGAPWKFHYGHESSTDVTAAPEALSHPILEGVARRFYCRSWLYNVVPLPADATPLLWGKSVGESTVPLQERVVNPVAWTRPRKAGRLFYTSLGHPEDFQLEPMQRMVVNAVHWCLGK